MSLAEVRSNILTFLSAGHETTANTLAWSTFLLSQSPQWFARVRQEADAELSNDRNRLLERLVVTRAVVDEALRLYPPIAALSRTSEQADRVGDLEIKSRSLIVISPYILHRHRRLWQEPDLFDPSRFLSPAKANIPRFAYLPFGAGPRTCIGSSFALQEATLVLAMLVHRFDIKLAPGAQVWPLQKITLRPEHGLPMKVTPRAAA
jgi:cytochrome P450